MIQSKLFVLKQEIELLWTDMSYERTTKPNGKPTSNVQGGLITVCFETTDKTDRILRWMTKESLDDTLVEIDKMEKGKVCFYADGFDYPPTRTYEFNDAFLVDYKQTFDLSEGSPMQTAITISPAIQNYGADLIKPWNVNYVPPSEDEPQESEEKKEPRFLGYRFENEQGTDIGQDNIKINDVIYLVIETENADGDSITLNLDDDDIDYEYNGKVLKNDTLKGVSISGPITKVKLKAVEQKK